MKIFSGLTDNFKANMYMSPFLTGVFFYLYPTLFGNSKTEVMLKNSLIFFCVYIYSSRFYSPDLDHREMRPGMAHFPIGKNLFQLMCKTPFKIFIPIQKILTLTWYYLWLPPSRIVTHRGIFHWPIIGLIVRNSYLLIIGLVLTTWMSGILDIHWDKTILDIFKIFLNPGDERFKIIALPIYVADFTHFAIDLWDSIKQGHSFCPPKIQRGLIASLFSKKK